MQREVEEPEEKEDERAAHALKHHCKDGKYSPGRTAQLHGNVREEMDDIMKDEKRGKGEEAI